MKKILLISHDASLTGAPKSILLIGELLKKEGYEIRWIIGKQGPRSSDFEHDPTRYWNRDRSNTSLMEKIIFKLKGGINGHKTQIIHWVKNWGPDLIINNTVVNGEIVEQLRVLNKPIISRIPEMQSVMAFYDTFDQSTSKVFNYSAKLVAASDTVKEQIVKYWGQPEGKVKVIYTASDMVSVPKEKHESFTVSACGSLISRKGIDLFLMVAKQCLVQGHDDIKFQWIGGNPKSLGYFEAIEDVRKLGLNEVVEIITETKDIRPYLAKSNVFLMTSKEDPFPIVNLEALKHGLPIICFEQSGGSVDIVKIGGGFTVPYMDINEMVTRLINVKMKNLKVTDLEINNVLNLFSTNNTKDSWLRIIKNFEK